jgi:hypothetical protein
VRSYPTVDMLWSSVGVACTLLLLTSGEAAQVGQCQQQLLLLCTLLLLSCQSSSAGPLLLTSQEATQVVQKPKAAAKLALHQPPPLHLLTHHTPLNLPSFLLTS